MKKLLSSTLFILTLVSLSTLLRPQPAKAADCGGPVPPKPLIVWAKPGPTGGQVTLYWDAAPYANRYAVAYGTTSNKYIYGADNIGGVDARSYTVKSLMPGTKYFFRLAAANGCSSSAFSDEVMAQATGGTAMEAVKVASPQVSKGVGVQRLWAKAGPRVGEVTLYWMNNENAENYHLVYGTEHGKFKYGQLNIGKVNKFTVGKLVPGREYHFALVPVINGQAMYTTPQVMATAYGGGEVVVTTKENLVTPKPKVTTQVQPKVSPSKAKAATNTAEVMTGKEATPSPVISVVSTIAPESSPSGK